MKKALTKKEQRRIVEGLATLFYAREIIIEAKKTLKNLSGGNEFLQTYIAFSVAFMVGVVVTNTFGTGKLRDEACKVLAQITEEPKVLVN